MLKQKCIPKYTASHKKNIYAINIIFLLIEAMSTSEGFSLGSHYIIIGIPIYYSKTISVPCYVFSLFKTGNPLKAMYPFILYNIFCLKGVTVQINNLSYQNRR